MPRWSSDQLTLADVDRKIQKVVNVVLGAVAETSITVAAPVV